MKILTIILTSLFVAIFWGCTWERINNYSPTIKSINLSAPQVLPGEEVTVEVIASDPEGDELTYQYQPSGGEIKSISDNKITWIAPKKEGIYFIEVTVRDNDNMAQKSITIKVLTPSKSMPLWEEGYDILFIAFKSHKHIQVIEKSLVIEAAGGQIRFNYENFPAVSVLIPPDKTSHLINSLSSIQGVVFIQHLPDVVKSDQGFQTGMNLWNVEQIGAHLVHQIGEQYKGEGITIAVIDTGIDGFHPLLQGQLISGTWIYYDADNLFQDMGLKDETGHGTEVAGIISQVAPSATILSVKVIDPRGHIQWDAMLKGVDYAIKQGVDVINLSLQWNIGQFISTRELIIYSSSRKHVEEWYNKAQRADIIAVAAAGKSSPDRNIILPAIIPNYWTVEGTASNPRPTSQPDPLWRGHVPSLDIVISAPAEDIKTTSQGGGLPALVSGVSYAVPHVSGVIALAWGMNRTLSVEELENRIWTMSIDFPPEGRDDGYGWGRLYAGVRIYTPEDGAILQAGSQEILVAAPPPRAVQQFAQVHEPRIYVNNVKQNTIPIYLKNVGLWSLRTEPLGPGTYEISVRAEGITLDETEDKITVSVK